MDTSETYIKMCEKATEIQLLAPDMQTRIYIRGNIYNCSTKDDSAFFWCMDTYKEDGFGNSISISTVAIWLPRQDQLQDMVINDPYKGLLNMQFFFADFFYDVVTDEDGLPQDSQKFTSLEQIWLAFVMLDKHSKEWDGEEWLVANKDS